VSATVAAKPVAKPSTTSDAQARRDRGFEITAEFGCDAYGVRVLPVQGGAR
jgi:hypothetical protein